MGSAVMRNAASRAAMEPTRLSLDQRKCSPSHDSEVRVVLDYKKMNCYHEVREIVLKMRTINVESLARVGHYL